jgi:uncharacterized protein (TIGR00255 family)
MKSMTGYGKAMVAGDDFSVSVDVKTVNNRFLDIHLRVGSELAALEPGVKKRVTSRLTRGRVDELERMREQEGETLKAELRERVKKIEAIVPTIEAAAAGLAEAYRVRLQKRIGELLNRGGQVVEIDPARLAQEVAYLADRSDVSEEMVRLRSHLTQFQEALDAPGEAGKMLDFLLQELNREANTTLSKSTDLVIKEAGLAIKAEVEKLREQVQNVE